ncbi:MAG: G5 domain-containing protein [Candidatus Nomurabacteria bacterium]|jgi:uncharacterized protein YabE (DUF348 family)|nr:G5 domain-containing protein [Candidatus Nomurabacteria bacterium]
MKRFHTLLFTMRSPWLVVMALAALFIVAATITATVMATSGTDSTDKQYYVVTIYDEDIEKTIISTGGNVTNALETADLSISKHDTIEPALDQELQDAIMIVNIHRSRPIMVIDGQRQVRVITAAQDHTDIAATANVQLYPEDTTKMSLTNDLLLPGGAGLKMEITRAKVVNLKLYGQELVVRTQKTTVAEFLKEKNIQLGPKDGMNQKPDAEVKDGMQLHIWRDGIQTVTTTEAVPFETKITTDPTRRVGYRDIQVKGKNGQKTVIYKIEMRGGKEISRKIISEVINTPAIRQVEIIGTKSTGGLTVSKGVNYFVDSKGVVHRETYYDLPMHIVMRNCGQGGYYAVRSDGVKIDRDGFVIVAAHLGNYPRCSVVETSLGAGKVYDTGGFVSRHPHGWDIATDWTNHDGR